MPESNQTMLRLATLSMLVLIACQTGAPMSASTLHVPCKDAFSLEPRRGSGSIALLAANRCHVPIFVELSFSELQNLAASKPLPVRMPVQANETLELVRLERIDPYEATRYESAYAAVFGDSAPQPDPDFPYAFPFDGSHPRRLDQGIGGSKSHKGSSHYSFDFEMPIGTPVLAARSGIVLSVVDGFAEGGFHERFRHRSNVVLVLHSDGTIGMYAHLSAGARVKEGARVETGDLLGSSGNSGYSLGPHLHFEVGTQRPGREQQSIPIRFRGGIVPVEGGSYPPAASRTR